jgi:hypothetical protein
VHNEGESRQESIQCFYNMRNVIPEVDDKSIIIYLKKGLKDTGVEERQEVESHGSAMDL